MTSEGMELAVLLPKIKRGQARRRILDLVRAPVDDEDKADAAED